MDGKKRRSKQLEVKICGFDRKLLVAELVKDLERYCMNDKNAYVFSTGEIRNEHKEVYKSAFD